MSIPSIHSSLRSQANQQNAPASQYERGQLHVQPAVRVTISQRSGMAQASFNPSASDVLSDTMSAGRLAGSPFESRVTMRRGAAAYQAWSKA